MTEMTPKEQYEARKTERKRKAAEHGGYKNSGEESEAFMDMLDRFVTAMERIATSLEVR